MHIVSRALKGLDRPSWERRSADVRVARITGIRSPGIEDRLAILELIGSLALTIDGCDWDALGQLAAGGSPD